MESELPLKNESSSFVMWTPPDDFSFLRKGEPPPPDGANAAPTSLCFFFIAGLVDVVVGS